MGAVAIFLWIVLFFGGEYLFHKFFRVFYLGFKAIITELFVWFFVSMWIAGAIAGSIFG